MKIEAKCLICGKETSVKAMGYHLKTKHGEGMIRGRNWERIGKKTDYQKYSKTDLYRSKICNRSYNNMSSITSHLRNVHKQGTKAGVNWERTARPKQNKKVSEPKYTRVITPEIKCIDIPVILRIPLTLGQVQIISTETKE